MPQSPNFACILSLSRALRQARAISAGDPNGLKVTYETVGDAFGMSESTGGEILKDGSYDAFAQQWNAALCSPLGEIVGSVLTCNTPFRLVRVKPNLDTDGDGTIDKGDAEFGLAQVAKTACTMVANAIAASDGKHYTADECAEALRHKDQLHQQLEDAFAVIVKHTNAPRLTA